MVGSLWAAGVSIDPGRLIDDADTAYYLTVVASYRKFFDLKAQESAAHARAAM
jgi:hypothetical protein